MWGRQRIIKKKKKKANNLISFIVDQTQQSQKNRNNTSINIYLLFQELLIRNHLIINNCLSIFNVNYSCLFFIL
jgi:hypothetical protein